MQQYIINIYLIKNTFIVCSYTVQIIVTMDKQGLYYRIGYSLNIEWFSNKI